MDSVWGHRVLVSAVVSLLVVLLAAPASAITISATDLDVSGLEATDAARMNLLWGEFLEGAPGHRACLLENRPAVVAQPDMAPRAAYSPSAQTLYVKPGGLVRLVVFHELAHHLDFTCGAASAIGDDFKVSQGLSPSKAWWQEGNPVTWPAEYFANAVAIALGEESRHGLTPEAVEVVRAYLAGDPVAPTLRAPGMSLGEIHLDVA